MKLDVQGQGGRIILDVDGLGEWEVMDVICVAFLKLTVQIKLALYPCDPFLINNRNMTGNSVEKCFVVLNVKSEVKLRLKRFIDFKTFYLMLSP